MRKFQTNSFYYPLFLILAVGLSACDNSDSTQQDLHDASQGTQGDGNSNNTGNTTPVTGAPVLSIAKSAAGSGDHFFGTSEGSYWTITNAKSDLKFCIEDLIDTPSNCSDDSKFVPVPVEGAYKSSDNSYTLSNYALTNAMTEGLKKIYVRNGSDVASNAYSLTLGIVAAVEAGGRLYDGVQVSGNFVIKGFGLESNSSQWCAADISFESPSKCNNTAKYEDISTSGTNWSYNANEKSLSLSMVHSQMNKTTYKVRFRDKTTGAMSGETLFVVK